MNIILKVFIVLIVSSPVFAQSTNTSLQATAVSIPGGERGIGFDDLNFSSNLHKVLVPAGHTGKLYLIDPTKYSMTTISGFSFSPEKKKGQEVGITSADEGEGFIFVLDHGTKNLDMVDVKAGAIIAAAPLAGDSDYVRYVGGHEVWVTEPHNKQMEVFAFTAVDKPTLSSVRIIPVLNGPESLVIDHVNHRAYTNLGKEAVAIDLHSHTIVAQWPNECEKSRGDALDEQKGFLFVSCAEGKAIVFDVNHNNIQLSSLATGPGVDVISYNSTLSHLYFTGSKNATVSVLGVSSQGQLSLLGVGQAAMRSHCVVGDNQNNMWVCDPLHGQLLRYKDTYPIVK